MIYNGQNYTVLENDNSLQSSGVADIDSVSSNYFSTLRTRSIIEPEMIYNKFPHLDNVPPALEMDYSRILNKPFFVKNIIWNATSPIARVLGTVKIPLDILINQLALVPFNASVFYRSKITLLLQVSGTPMHQGTVIAAAHPIGSFGRTINGNILDLGSYMCAPHVFLSANQSTSAALEVPFYCNGKLEYTDVDGTTVTPYTKSANYAEVNLFVLNPLQAPTSASTQLTISVHAMFTYMEFYVPHTDPIWYSEAKGTAKVAESESEGGFFSNIKILATKTIDSVTGGVKRVASDFFDILRNGVRQYTGLHSPNNPSLMHKSAVVLRQNVNCVDTPVQFEKMDPYYNYDRICKDAIFDTSIDEMELDHILRKPQYIGTCQVNSLDATGTILWSRPITPFQQVVPITYLDPSGGSVNSTAFSNVLQVMSRCSRYWKGSLKIHVQSVMSNFHFCKIALARNYSPSTQSLSNFPTFASIPNLMTDFVEFSAGGQVHTFDLPFCSALNQLPSTSDFTANSVQHGMYYLYLAQPLVVNGAVVLNVNFNIYISAGDDFQFMGYAVDPSVIMKLNATTEAPSQDDFVAESSTGEAISDQKDLLNDAAVQYTKIPHYIDNYDFRPITHLRDVGRRMYRRLANIVIPNISDLAPLQFDIATMLGVRPPTISGATGPTYFPCATLDLIQNMFLGYAGGARLKIIVSGTNSAMAWYVPPGFVLDQQLQSGGSLSGYFVGTQPLPYDTASGVNLAAEENALFRYVTPVTNSLAGPYSSTQTVTIERPNHYSTAGNATSQINTGANGSISLSHCELEMEVPNMSPYRFVGDTTKFNGATDVPIYNSATTEMGTIIVTIPPPYLAAPGVVNVYQSITIDLLVSFDDVARLGYQVYCPRIILPAVLGATGAYGQITSSLFPNPMYNNIAPQSTPFYTNPYFTKSS